MSTDKVPEAEVDKQIPGSSQEGYPNEDDMVPNGAVAQNGAAVREIRGNKRAYITVFVLFVINLLNYMDRQTIAGINTYLSQQIRKNLQNILARSKMYFLSPHIETLQSSVQLIICCLKSASFRNITFQCFA